MNSEQKELAPTCTCRAHISRRGLLAKDYEESAFVSKCLLCEAAPDLLKACKALLPEGWDDGTMDHMPGVKIARESIARAEGRQ